ncbi:hypothetical protein BH10ACT3_BH10ACT3_03380 [soil metagenome]
MTSRRDRDDPDDERPALQLVRTTEGEADHGSSAPVGPQGPGTDETYEGSETPDVPDTRITADEVVLPVGLSPADEAREILSDADPAAYFRLLNGLVRSSHSSVLQALPYSPALSYHDPACVVVEPEPTNIDTIELYARAAYPDFDKVLRDAFNDPAQDNLLTALYHLLVTEGENVALITNHGQIIDIALVMAGLLSAMLDPDRSFGVLGERTTLDELAERFNVLVSRMITTRQAFNVPAIQVLQSASRIFLSVPQNASRRRAKLEAAMVRDNNVLMRRELDQQMAQGGQLLAMAASGSQDLTIPGLMLKARAAWRQRRGDDPGEAPTLHLQPLYDGTISLMQSCRYVLPIAICLDAATPACVIGGLTRLTEKDDCHRIMDWIALAHQEATGTPTIYHWHEDDLLTQVRALLNR